MMQRLSTAERVYIHFHRMKSLILIAVAIADARVSVTATNTISGAAAVNKSFDEFQFARQLPFCGDNLLKSNGIGVFFLLKLKPILNDLCRSCQSEKWNFHKNGINGGRKSKPNSPKKWDLAESQIIDSARIWTIFTRTRTGTQQLTQQWNEVETY